ncbi:hypothetical protein FC62_GL001306 [Amylolactobacillus amylotrophicus DSM 20534]|uniref:Ribosomal-protein-alanine N-acetyltransferase n=3 Tax=Amylolactobacillus TaxID=2767876 RepID=A0A1L6XAT3_9LACO|nr:MULTISPECIES: ribosomal protein S18-alanine N-acetyltransferase [Amylolactobacillus]APT18082.1 ribosomal-protein-alanine N-acetyltransferase [Amylolactobacillus amylophilus DSM 20533 = JCM 1125]KRK37428.1 hypothetical protein FC62_GL001306 [Amylolactobacillus amylotrophicus DSM 20534]KRM42101.1 hypothetical protein FD40_GL000885 [Amylolactobacillus amylophilus DSM 20533 = JCM 1125]GED80558.1 ribosomal-protein-alanine acetyltransferase [Amylolactobacillus amylophilus]
MLKKFSDFFKPVPQFDLSFEPFVKVISHLSLQFMKANDSHLEDLLNLERRVYRGRTPWDRFSFRNELKKHHNSLYLVVYDGSQLVGFIGARFSEQEGHITNIAISPEYQHRKIGSFLVSMMIDYGRRNNCTVITLEVRMDNLVAQTAYKKLGFKPNIVRKNYYYTEKVDGLNMVLDLKGDGFK